MKLHLCKTIGLSLVLLASLSGGPARADGGGGGNGAGHGGHPAELFAQARTRARIDGEIRAALKLAREDFSTWASSAVSELPGRQVVALIDQVLSGRIQLDPTTDKLELNGVTKLAINYQDTSLIRVNQALWSSPRLPDGLPFTPGLKRAILIHELIPFRRDVFDTLEIKDYARSSNYYLEIETRTMNGTLPRPKAAAPAGKPVEWVVLFSRYFDTRKEGVPLHEAKRLCSEVRKGFGSQYGVLGCTYLNKEWREFKVIQELESLETGREDVVRRHGRETITYSRSRLTSQSIVEVETDFQVYGILVQATNVGPDTQLEVFHSGERPSDPTEAFLRKDTAEEAMTFCTSLVTTLRQLGQAPAAARCSQPKQDALGWYCDILKPVFLK